MRKIKAHGTGQGGLKPQTLNLQTKISFGRLDPKLYTAGHTNTGALMITYTALNSLVLMSRIGSLIPPLMLSSKAP